MKMRLSKLKTGDVFRDQMGEHVFDRFEGETGYADGGRTQFYGDQDVEVLRTDPTAPAPKPIRHSGDE